MAVGAFTDKQRPPAGGEIAVSLGASGDLWRKTVALLEHRFGGKPELRFYGRNYGWAVRYRRRGKALASLYPGEGRFTTQVIVPAAVEADVVGRLRPGTRALLEAAAPLGEGRWLFLPVACDADVAELALLLEAKLVAAPAR